jgi:hypothetical protein
MRKRVRRQSYVDRALDQRARAHATANRVTDSSVTEAALTKYLENSVDEDLIVRRLDGVVRAVQSLEHDLEVLTASFAVFARFNFFSVPRPTPDDQERVSSTYKLFLRSVSQRLHGGLRLAREVRDVDSPRPPRPGSSAVGGSREGERSE